MNKFLSALLILFLPIFPLYGFSYIKGGVVFIGEDITAPTFSLGQRCDLALVALDLSWSFASSKKHKVAFYSSPRVAALLYVNPMHSNRIYIGGAGSWAYIVNAKKNRGYSGLVGEAIVGLEFESFIGCHPFIEVSESFPFKRFSNRIGHIGHRASTSIMFGIGI